ncbi:MAG: hypothetical protein AAFU85_28370 [Planctomycetota bacterium]
MRLLIFVGLQLLGLSWGTMMICDPAVVNNWQVVGWAVSFVSTSGLLLTGLREVRVSKSPFMQAVVVSLLTFLTVFVTCYATAAFGVWANA